MYVAVVLLSSATIKLSDHYLKNQLKGAIYEQWLAILQQFSVDIEYKPAEEMQVPDTLSRNLTNEASDFTSPAEDDPYFPYVTELATDRVGYMSFFMIS